MAGEESVTSSVTVQWLNDCGGGRSTSKRKREAGEKTSESHPALRHETSPFFSNLFP